MKALILLFALVFGVKAQTNIITVGDQTHYGLKHTNNCSGTIYYDVLVFTNNQASTWFKTVTNGQPLTFTCTRTPTTICNWLCKETLRSGCNSQTVIWTNAPNESNFLLQITSSNSIPQFPFTTANNTGFLP